MVKKAPSLASCSGVCPWAMAAERATAMVRSSPLLALYKEDKRTTPGSFYAEQGKTGVEGQRSDPEKIFPRLRRGRDVTPGKLSSPPEAGERRYCMMEGFMKIVVIDGQGGRLGRLLVEGVRSRLPQAEIHALGTNSAATAAMLKGGADHAATGENPVVWGVRDADAVLGPIGILVANAILGEVTPAMARAVGSCRARKFLVPMNNCGVVVAGVAEGPMAGYAEQTVEALARELGTL